MSDLDIPADDAIGVWYDLERALAGKNGYGGDVAEIYAYRLVPAMLQELRKDAKTAKDAPQDQARLAGRNMTRLLRHFLDLHEGAVVAIEDREGFRLLDLDVEEFPPFDYRVHLRVSQAQAPVTALSISKLRSTIAKSVEHTDVLIAMLDELATYRATARLGTESRKPAVTDDLPPDAATGLYLDRAFDVEDLGWIITALTRGDGPSRATQLMLVFEAIRRDERAAAEFLRVMNSIVLPLCRRLRLKVQPHLAKIGAAGE